MNKIPFLILLGGVALASCNTTPAIGDWQDNIKLSTKVVSFNSGKDSVTIKTGGDFWWLTCISLDGTPHTDFGKTNVQTYPYSVKQDYFYFTRVDKNTIAIKADANGTTVSRSIVVNLEAGDYFDAIKITQKSK